MDVMNSELEDLRAMLERKLRGRHSSNWVHGVATCIDELADELDRDDEPECADLLRVAAGFVRSAAERRRFDPDLLQQQ